MTRVAPPSPPLLRAQGLTKRYGSVTAVEDVSFDILPGEVVALVGDNGAGKSTVTKILSGVIRPTAGRVELHGREVDLDDPGSARELGIETVFQDLALALNLSVTANVFLGRELRGPLGFLRQSQMDRVTRTHLERLRIRIPDVRQLCGELSGGQRQAVAVARSAVWGRDLLLLDEPTAALGVEEQHQVGELISQVQAQGMAVLLVSHNLLQVHERSDRILVMFQGRLIADLVKRDVSIDDIVKWVTGAALHG